MEKSFGFYYVYNDFGMESKLLVRVQNKFSLQVLFNLFAPVKHFGCRRFGRIVRFAANIKAIYKQKHEIYDGALKIKTRKLLTNDAEDRSQEYF